MQLYDIVVKDNELNDIKLDQYKGKVLIIVNTATKCGFTPQYEELEKLYEEYKDKGLEILDFPCNQFLFQSPGSNEEIHTECQLRFKTKFKRFDKVKVNGKDACELYKFLKENASPKQRRVKWNFAKFLVSKDGSKILKFGSTVKPYEMKEYIDKFLSE